MMDLLSTSKEATLWKLIAVAVGIAGAFTARKTIQAAWRFSTKEDPPLNPASPETGWKEAFTWTILSGMAAGIARLAARRGAAGTWTRVMGTMPPVSTRSK